MTASNLRLLLFLAVPLFAQVTGPDLPAAAKEIAVTAGAHVRLKYHYLAAGKQIYRCENGAWSKGSTPDATLYEVSSGSKVHHGAGPSWTAVEGKGTVKAIGPTAVHFAAPDGVSIDWLKLDADKASRSGIFADVTTIQRVYTGGGKAPATGCTGTQTYESPYTAHYYFWIAQ